MPGAPNERDGAGVMSIEERIAARLAAERASSLDAAKRALIAAGIATDTVDAALLERVVDALADEEFERGCRCYPPA